MNKADFYSWFDKLSPKLLIRRNSFYKIFNYLDKMPDPIIIVETGCLRIKNNFLDGQSTLLFDKYTEYRKNDAKVFSVDIDPKATKVCSEVVSKNVSINTGDSVKYLEEFTKNFDSKKKAVSLFYLDSFDCNWNSLEQSSLATYRMMIELEATWWIVVICPNIKSKETRNSEKLESE